ncbi:heme exporter protein CcmD [uncultured Bartonella sp.]|uniref:heme exporter protein CcmD n=1 Tax=uncultured Bartonella sp. TaxID=104108 RepID=UPI00261DDB3B|nr:heme exporter protein CcmD [uncultured Bartonella sp.]
MNTAENAIGFSDRIDIFLGSFDHGQIVTLSYAISAMILLCLVIYIVLNGKHQKARLNQLEHLGTKRASTTKIDTHGQA